MPRRRSVSRRDFIKGVAITGAATYVGGLKGTGHAQSATKSRVFKVENCPVHDGELRHVGMDCLLDLLADFDIKLYKTADRHPWGSAKGIIAHDDIVLLKVNCQWKCRGTTNTDVVRGLIHRILEHPDGFTGEIVIFENGQGQGSFDGNPVAWGSYDSYPIKDDVIVNSEDQILTVDELVNTVFAGYPVSSYLLDPVAYDLISDTDHSTDGFRVIDTEEISYPCFTTRGSHRVELMEGIWNGSTHDSNIKLINIPVFKTHGGTGITGALKHCYGIMSMYDSPPPYPYRNRRHYRDSGIACGRMYSIVRTPDLNIVDCIWVSHEQLAGYPESATVRTNILLGGIDPVALDYHASKHVLYPCGGSRRSEHDPDSFSGLITHLTDAQDFINSHGGIHGLDTNQGDSNIEVISRSGDCVIPAVSAGGLIAGASFLGYQMLKNNREKDAV